MKRRNLVQLLGAGLLSTASPLLTSGLRPGLAQGNSGGLTLQWLGHSCFLFTGSGQRILVNPFKPLGCTARYKPIEVESNLVMISSQLLDEGYVDTLPGDPKLLFESGIYRVNNLQIQGISTDHDRQGGRRFGQNLAWKWTQGGIKILHLGGIAAPISLEQQILMGQPDLLIVPIGGGAKNYNPEEAVKAVQLLKPRIIIPTQFLTAAADSTACSLAQVTEFQTLLSGITTQQVSGSIVSLSTSSLPKKQPALYLLSNPVA